MIQYTNNPVGDLVALVGGKGQVTKWKVWGTGLRTSQNRHRLQEGMDRLRDKISKCCQQLGVGCGINVSAKQGGKDGIAVNMLDQSQILSHDAHAIANGDKRRRAINWRINAPWQEPQVLPHELGHVGGYVDPDGGYINPKDGKPDLNHSPHTENLMNPTANGATGINKSLGKEMVIQSQSG